MWLSRIPVIAPTYTDNFHCIGSACEASCCHGWSVPVSRSAYEKYQALPPSPLRTSIDANIVLASSDPGAEGYGSEGFAKIRMNQSNSCPMLTADSLCQIHAQLGPGYLPNVCATYPRILRTLGGAEQNALAFSCPEAVRVALLNPIAWKQVIPVLSGPSVPGESKPDGLPASSAWAIRTAVLKVVTNRDFSLEQRLLLLGALCQKLDALPSQWSEDQVAACLGDFASALEAGVLLPGFETLPVKLSVQLDAVLRLAGLMLGKGNLTPRFVECIHSFTAGIGNSPGATLETLTASYGAAHDRYFVPFFERHPHILENYLVNTILRLQFPFGREGMARDASSSANREFTTLIAHFALTRGLLIGVAGFHRESFSVEHLVHAIQSASKHFDHHPDFPKLAYELLAECKLEGLNGAAILVRNRKSDSRVSEANLLPNLCNLPAMSY
jgi:lysine-N-methylase